MYFSTRDLLLSNFWHIFLTYKFINGLIKEWLNLFPKIIFCISWIFLISLHMYQIELLKRNLVTFSWTTLVTLSCRKFSRLRLLCWPAFETESFFLASLNLVASFVKMYWHCVSHWRAVKAAGILPKRSLWRSLKTKRELKEQKKRIHILYKEKLQA